MINVKRVVALLLALALVPLAAAADITGTWTASFDTEIGVQNYTYEFKVDGSELTGTAKSANGESQIDNGKIDGDAVSFTEKLNFQGMELVLTYTGQVVSDDEISFKRDVSGFAVEELVARRSK